MEDQESYRERIEEQEEQIRQLKGKIKKFSNENAELEKKLQNQIWKTKKAKKELKIKKIIYDMWCTLGNFFK